MSDIQREISRVVTFETIPTDVLEIISKKLDDRSKMCFKTVNRKAYGVMSTGIVIRSIDVSSGDTQRMYVRGETHPELVCRVSFDGDIYGFLSKERRLTNQEHVLISFDQPHLPASLRSSRTDKEYFYVDPVKYVSHYKAVSLKVRDFKWRVDTPVVCYTTEIIYYRCTACPVVFYMGNTNNLTFKKCVIEDPDLLQHFKPELLSSVTFEDCEIVVDHLNFNFSTTMICFEKCKNFTYAQYKSIVRWPGQDVLYSAITDCPKIDLMDIDNFTTLNYTSKYLRDSINEFAYDSD
jgi:hypothetical protein